MKPSKLLLVDGVVNLGLGITLITFHPAVVEFLGIPATDQPFYPTILGGVLFGIGVALFVEYFRETVPTIGLGLVGAMAINLCGGLVLAFWLIRGNLDIVPHGRIVLWGLVFILVILGGLELFFTIRKKEQHPTRKFSKSSK
jgi:peptidoglycan/LPS O-acetylase OafA/YrhL